MNYYQTLELKLIDRILKAELCLSLASLSKLQKESFQFLHYDELNYWHNIRFKKRQHSYLLGRYAAKQALARSMKLDKLSDILVRPGVFGQPVVYTLGPSHQKVQVSLSHSQSLSIALAFPEEHPMGIDLEAITSENALAIESELTLEEKGMIDSSRHHMLETLTVIWSIKEALSKVLRTGMTASFKIYALKRLSFQEYYWTSQFENFGQYQAIAFLLDHYVCSIVYPKNTNLMIDFISIQNWIKKV